MSIERFYQLAPFEISIECEAWEVNQKRQDYRVGLLCSCIWEPHRDKKKRRKPYTPDFFFPYLNGNNKNNQTMQTQQTPEQQLKIVEMLNAAYGGSDQRGGA